MTGYYREILCSDFPSEKPGASVQITGYYILGGEDDKPYISDSTGNIKLSFKHGNVPDLEHNQTIRIFGKIGNDMLDVDHIAPVNIDLSRFLHLKDLEQKF